MTIFIYFLWLNRYKTPFLEKVLYRVKLLFVNHVLSSRFELSMATYLEVYRNDSPLFLFQFDAEWH